MSQMRTLSTLAGSWTGRKLLWFTPESEPLECAATAEITMPAGERFAEVRYTWEYEGKPQTGLVLFGTNNRTGEDEAVFLDSFHQSGEMMICRGDASDEAYFSARGTYAAPPGPDWGWEIEIISATDSRLELGMNNIPPGHDPVRAVLFTFERP